MSSFKQLSYHWFGKVIERNSIPSIIEKLHQILKKKAVVKFICDKEDINVTISTLHKARESECD